MEHSDHNLIACVIELAGGLVPIARVCGVSTPGVWRWRKAGRLPFSDYTGDTHYAEAIELLLDGKVTVQELLTRTPPDGGAWRPICAIEDHIEKLEQEIKELKKYCKFRRA